MSRLVNLVIGFVAYSSVPYLNNAAAQYDNLTTAQNKIVELREAFYSCSMTNCNNLGYKTSKDVIKARQKTIESIGCKDRSIWMISQDLAKKGPPSKCTFTHIECPDGKSYTLNNEGKLIPFNKENNKDLEKALTNACK